MALGSIYRIELHLKERSLVVKNVLVGDFPDLVGLEANEIGSCMERSVVWRWGRIS